MAPHRPAGRKLRPFPTVALYAALVLAVGQSAVSNLTPDSPLRGGGLEKIFVGEEEMMRSGIADKIDAKSNGKSIALHVSISPALAAGDAGMELAGIYYYAAYQLYPRRIYVGQDDRVVNNASGLPGPHASRRWLADHGVEQTLEVSVDPRGHTDYKMDPVR